jgi:hypothetical protein
MPKLELPALGGARTLAQLEALARLNAGADVDPAALAECDRPVAEPATPAAADAAAPAQPEEA